MVDQLSILQQELFQLKKNIVDISRRSMYSSSGGGADSLTDITRPTKTIKTSYTLTTRDWYIGVSNHIEKVLLTLPSAIHNGREYVIKDESGYASIIPIQIVGTIDNDPSGLEIRLNNASVTLLYNNGWRLI